MGENVSNPKLLQITTMLEALIDFVVDKKVDFPYFRYGYDNGHVIYLYREEFDNMSSYNVKELEGFVKSRFPELVKNIDLIDTEFTNVHESSFLAIDLQ